MSTASAGLLGDKGRGVVCVVMEDARFVMKSLWKIFLLYCREFGGDRGRLLGH